MLVVCAALTMTAQELVQPNLDGFKYPALARAARIQGAVQLSVNSDGVQLLSGHPFLVLAAKSNLEKWTVPHASGTPLSAAYVFRLKEPVTQIVEEDQPIGDGFDRILLRLFHHPLTRKVKKENCIDSDESTVGSKNVTKDGVQSIEIDVDATWFCTYPQFVAMAVLLH